MLQSTAEQTEEEAGVKEKNYSVAQNLFYIFHPVWKEKPHYMLMLIGEAVLSIGMMLMAAAVSAVAVSSLEKGNDVIVLIGSIMAFFICYGAGNVVYTFLKIRNSLIHIEMRLEWYVPELFLKCMGMSVEKSEQESTRQRVEKAILAVSCNNRGVEGMSRNGMTFLANVLGMVVYVLIVGGLDIRILGLLIVLSGLTLISSEAAVRYDKKVTDRMASEERILNYVEHIVDDTAGGKDIRIFNLSGWLTGKYEQAMTARRKLNYGYDILDFCGNATEIVLAGVRDLCCYFYLLSMMQKGMSVGNFVFYLGLISGFASWFSQLSKTYGEMRKNNHQVNEFRSIVDEEKEGLEHKKIPTDGFDELEIVFDNVSYCYPGTEKKVLDQISFIWGKGEHLALVGLNGAGKSTLVKLICGFYVPTNGRVLVNGVDTRELNLTEYFKHLSAVFQNEWILSYTIGGKCCDGKRLGERSDLGGVKARQNRFGSKSAAERDFYLSRKRNRPEWSAAFRWRATEAFLGACAVSQSEADFAGRADCGAGRAGGGSAVSGLSQNDGEKKRYVYFAQACVDEILRHNSNAGKRKNSGIWDARRAVGEKRLLCEAV